MTPAGTSNELDVQNGWEENTHTHTHNNALLLPPENNYPIKRDFFGSIRSGLKIGSVLREFCFIFPIFPLSSKTGLRKPLPISEKDGSIFCFVHFQRMLETGKTIESVLPGVPFEHQQDDHQKFISGLKLVGAYLRRWSPSDAESSSL